MTDESNTTEPNSEENATGETAAEESPVEAAPAENEPAAPATSSPPAVWPALIIVGVQIAVTFGMLTVISTNIENIIALVGLPLLGAIALGIWWMTSRSVLFRERVLGVVIVVAALAIIGLAHGVTAPNILPFALMALMAEIVLFLLIARNSPWHAQRRFVAAGIVVVTGAFLLVRVDAVGGDLLPHISMRWSERPEAAALALPTPDTNKTATLPEAAGPQDWPGFRGADLRARVSGVEFGTNWDESPPTELWRHPVGLGWSSFCVVGDYFFTQEQRGDEEWVVCYESETGDTIWVNRTAARFDDSTGSGPRATPTFEAGRLYAQGATGLLQCLDAATGDVIWSRDLREDTGAKEPQWGFASSPTISGDNVIVFGGADNGKSVVAYNKETGDVAWTAGEGNHSYGSAQLANFVSTPQVIMSSVLGVQAFAPDTGEKLWEYESSLGSFARIVQPCVTEPNSLLIGSGPQKGTLSLRVQKDAGGAWDISEEWTADKFRPYFNDFIFHKGFCYGFDGNRLVCIDNATGYRRWRGDRLGGQVLMIVDMDAFLVLSEKGEVVLFQATPNEPVELGRIEAIDGKTWNHPVVAQGKLFVRNAEEMACFELPSS